MPDGGLDRADRTEAALFGHPTKRLGQAVDLDRVPGGSRCRGPPGSSGCGSIPPAAKPRSAAGLRPRVRAGHRLGVAVVHGAALDHREDLVAVGQCPVQALEHQGAGPSPIPVPSADLSNVRVVPSGTRCRSVAALDRQQHHRTPATRARSQSSASSARPGARRPATPSRRCPPPCWDPQIEQVRQPVGEHRRNVGDAELVE